MSQTEQEARDQSLFNRIAATYRAKDLFEPSGVARQLRLEQTMRRVPLGRPVDLLEVGCGTGFTVRYLAGTCSRYLGIDHAESMIELARSLERFPRAQFQSADIRHFETSQRFDVVLLIGVLHHLDDPSGSLANMVELLRPGGWLVANEPQPSNPVVHWLRVLRKRLDGKYSSDQKELAEHELRQLLEDAGLADVRIVPQGWFSTPFAEVRLRPRFLTLPAARIACRLDRILERTPAAITRRLSWNLIAAGRKRAA